jgi:hypothetical protein
MSLKHYSECHSEFQKVLKLCFIRCIAFLLLHLKQRLGCIKSYRCKRITSRRNKLPRSIKKLTRTEKTKTLILGKK